MRSLVDSIQSLSASLLVALTVTATNGVPSAYAQDDLGDQPAQIAGDTSGFYVTGAAGANWPTMRTNSGDLGTFEEFSNPGIALELGAGYDFGAIRLEATYALDTSYLKGYNSVDGIYFDYSSGGRTQKNSAFLSGYWDLLASKSWTSYLGAGIGYSHLYVQPFAEPGRSYAGVSHNPCWGISSKRVYLWISVLMTRYLRKLCTEALLGSQPMMDSQPGTTVPLAVGVVNLASELASERG
jgi:hypothetical protein